MRIPQRVFAFCSLLAAVAIVSAAASFASETKQNEKETAKGVKQETMEAIQAIKSYSIEQRDKAVKEAKEVMEDLDARIERAQADIQEGWDQMDRAARKNVNATLKTLREQRNELSEWYGGLKHSSANAWDHVKEGFVEGYESLAAAFDKAEDEFESDAEGRN